MTGLYPLLKWYQISNSENNYNLTVLLYETSPNGYIFRETEEVENFEIIYYFTHLQSGQ